MRKKRKYVHRKITNDLIIGEVTKIRRKNNVAWMTILSLAFKARPRQASKVMNQIIENDRLVTKWMARLG